MVTVARWCAGATVALVLPVLAWGVMRGGLVATRATLALPLGTAAQLLLFAAVVLLALRDQLSVARRLSLLALLLAVATTAVNGARAAELAGLVARSPEASWWLPAGQAAGSHLLLGLALVATLWTGPVLRIARVAGLVAVTFAATVSLSSSAFGGEGYALLLGIVPMSGLAGLTTLLMAFAVAAMAPRQWPLGTLIQQPSDGVMVGHLLPYVVAIPVLVPLLVLSAQYLGAGDQLQVVLATVVPTLALFGVLGLAVRDHRQLTSAIDARDSQLRVVLDELPVAVMLRGADGTLLHLNPGAERFVARMGVDLAAIQTSPEGLLDHIEVTDEQGRPHEPADLPVVAAVRDGRSRDATLGFRLPDGGHAWYSIRAAPVPLADGTAGTVVTLDDVTEQHEARHRTAVAERALRLTFEHAPIGIAVVAPGGRLLEVNTALCDLLGFEDQADLVAAGLETPTHPDDREPHEQWVASWFDGTQGDNPVDRRFRHVDGHSICTQMSAALVRDDDGTPLHLIAQVVDVTERRALEKELREAAVRDPLTGLANRRALVARLREAHQRQQREGGDVGLLFVDLDDFKSVNDRYGHEAGDRLLIETGRRMLTVTRRTDTVCRLGGDEFAILCTPVDGPTGVADLVDRLGARSPMVTAGREPVSVGQSIGAIIVEPGEELDGALSRADAAMYRSKRRRNSRSHVVSPPRHREHSGSPGGR